MPDNEVSRINARLSRVKSSTIARMRKRRPSLKQSDTKSSDQRSLGPCGNARGARTPKARLRGPRWRTCSGEKSVLGLWIEQAEGAKFWLKVVSGPFHGSSPTQAGVLDGEIEQLQGGIVVWKTAARFDDLAQGAVQGFKTVLTEDGEIEIGVPRVPSKPVRAPVLPDH